MSQEDNINAVEEEKINTGKKKNIYEELEKKETQKEIEEWWFDKTLFPLHKNTRTDLKIYYAFVQVFHHNHFRSSTGGIEETLKDLIKMLEGREEYRNCVEEDQKLKELVLGSVYRRLGQFRTERFQDADTEQMMANQYLEGDSSYLDSADQNTSDQSDSEAFVIRLLFLLNKAKYFRDIAEKDALRVDSCYWRAIILFQEIVEEINERRKRRGNSLTEGVIARIYVSARLNIVRVYRMQQDSAAVQKECIRLIRFCINSIRDKEEKYSIEKAIAGLPEVQDGDEDDGFSVEEYKRDDEQNDKQYVAQDNKNMVDYLFEDYILQALLQLGIFYRDCVDFNGSRNGKHLVKQAMEVFLILGIVDRIKDKKIRDDEEERDKASYIRCMEQCLDKLEKLELNLYQESGETKVDCSEFAEEIKNLCTGTERDGEGEIIRKSVLKNDDAKNNLAVCLKKLGYFDASAKILDDQSLLGNRFAEYNSCKCNLESGSVENLEKIEEKFWKSKNTGSQGSNYICMDDLKSSNHKWLFLYARYLYALQRYEEAEELFHDIRSAKAIQWDSLELKSAYLEVQCLMKREKYLLAGRVLKNIHDSLLRAAARRLPERRHEIRTEIDLGYCYLMEDKYQAALDVYKKLLAYLLDEDDQEKIGILLDKLEAEITGKPDEKSTDQGRNKKWHDVDQEHQMKILHNLYDCWTYLQGKGQSGSSPEKSNGAADSRQGKETDQVERLIEDICMLDKSEMDRDILFIKSLRKLNFFKSQSEDNREEWERLSNDFGRVLSECPRDIVIYSCWVISKVNHCIRIPVSDPDFYTEKKRLLEGLVFSATPITMKCYIEVAKLIVREENKCFLDIASKDPHRSKSKTELERSFLELFCHVELLDNGINQTFMHLMEGQSFQSIEIVTRARVLAMIAQLYGYILQIKNRFRVTYDDLTRIKEKYCYKTDEDGPPPICQYTRLETLKYLLLEKEYYADGKIHKEEPQFHMYNVARMNDACEGTVFKRVFEAISGEQAPEYANNEKLIQRYINSNLAYQDEAKHSTYDSDVYLASFSMNRKNFGLWSNYADDEKGCIIGFDDSFFDLVDKNDYSILDDEAEENALYRIIYVDDVMSLSKGNEFGLAGQEEGDRTLLQQCIPKILKIIVDIEKELPDEDTGELGNEAHAEISQEAAEEIRAFITDRLNEIRFLFKSVSYSYEEELRMLRCSHTPKVDSSAASPIPRLYIPVEKRLDNLTLILGSKVEWQQFKELSVWAKDTGRVKKVIWSDLNRPE